MSIRFKSEHNPYYRYQLVVENSVHNDASLYIGFEDKNLQPASDIHLTIDQENELLDLLLKRKQARVPEVQTHA